MNKFLLVTIISLLAICHGYLIQPRIINGVLSDVAQYPFYVHLRSNRGQAAGQCGASLLSDRWIVTAAHCLHERTIVHAFFGIRSNGRFTAHSAVNLSSIYIHPVYAHSSDFLANDIALIKLSEPVTLSLAIQPAKLPTDCGENIDDGVAAIAPGNGMMAFTAQQSYDSMLREISLTTLPYHICRRLAQHTDEIKTVICANSQGKQSTYRGDSGGPLIRDSDKAVIGLTSYAEMLNKDVNVDYPVKVQVFTNIHYYFDWIADITGLELPKCARFYRI